MGLFEFFGKKKEKDYEAAELLKAIIQYQVESRKDGIDTDDIPKGYGQYGLCKTNPVPNRGIPSSNEYLSRLHTKDRRSIEISLIGSTSVV